jgi:hypothetical protein
VFKDKGLAKAIKATGGLRALARALGPYERVLDVERVTGMPREELSEIARRLLAAAHRIHSQPAEGEMLDVERDIEGEPLASRPVVVFALDDRRIGVSGVAGKFQHGGTPGSFETVGGGRKDWRADAVVAA